MAKLAKQLDVGVILQPQASDPSSPVAGQLQVADGSARTAGLYRYTGSAWVSHNLGTLDVAEIDDGDSPYTASASNDVILANATADVITVNLPTAVGIEGKVLRIKKTDSTFKVVTIEPDGAETVDSAANTTLNTIGETLELVSDGANWIILARRISNVITSFTPTGSWSTNTTLTGRYQRDGRLLKVRVTLSLAGAPDTAALTINLPSGLTIDTTALSDTYGDYGAVRLLDSGTQEYSGRVTYSSTTVVGVQYLDDGAAAVIPGNVTQAAPYTFASGDKITLQFEVPIVGWNG